MTDHDTIFLSYSRNDLAAADTLRDQLEGHGLAVFKDDQSIREGELWLNRLQEAVDGCSGFVVLIGRDGVSRWIGAETQTALARYFGPHDDQRRLPIFPILLGETAPEGLPAFLRLFQATRWDGSDALPERMFEQIRERSIVAGDGAGFEGCPFVGLDAFQVDQAHLFFGRQRETLDALACFDTRPGSPTVRWLEINGNSGSGKSSLMNAGLLPLVEQGWLWPRTGYAKWRLIGPMMPGQHPVRMLAEQLARSFDTHMSDVRRRLTTDDELALAEELRSHKQPETAFLLAIDQFEELFTFADPDERQGFDRLLATALEDPDCPLFVISTVRADFLDRFGEDLPRLVAVRNRAARVWTLPPIGKAGLREVIGGPARLAGLDVSEVQAAIVAEARDEPGALPLVENALHWLWEQRKGNRLVGTLFTDEGGLAGILKQSADGLLDGLGKQRGPALELLFRMVNVDPEGRRHTRQRIPLDEAIAAAGGGEQGRALVTRLAGARAHDGGRARGPLRLITVTEEGTGTEESAQNGRWVNLIHETLIRSKGLDPNNRPRPYWPTLWNYIEANKQRAARRERLRLEAREWNQRSGAARLFGLAGWGSVFGLRGLAAQGSIEGRYLRWSRVSACVQVLLLAAALGLAAESVYWAKTHGLSLDSVTTRWSHRLGQPLPLPTLVEVPAGRFQMGSDKPGTEEYPWHPVSVAKPFWLAATEVTFAEYDAYCEATVCSTPSRQDESWGRADRPVINVDWDDARHYVEWLSAMTGVACRLPSEAEWEYAARAGTTTKYALPAPDGSDDIEGLGLANCRGCGGEWGGKNRTAPVGQFDANAWKLHDMHGNVREWTADCWHGDYDEAPDDGGAWLEGNGGECGRRVVRGGSWNYDPAVLRSAFRDWGASVDRFFGLGFRVVCSSPILDH